MSNDNNRYFFGIDLGTTNSAIAVYDSFTDSNRTINIGRSPLLKSMISYNSDTDEVRIGTQADVENTIKDVKSSIGNVDKQYKLNGTIYDPVVVSSMILKKLKEVAEEEFGHQFEVKQVTITVPAKFDHLQRSNTVKAATMAGLEVISLINEPTSASLAYIEKTSKRETVLVYDLGGGTFDASIVSISPSLPAIKLPELNIKTSKITEQIVTVICSDGDINLGGNDLDELIVIKARDSQGISMTEEELKDAKRSAQKLKEQNLDVVVWKSKTGSKELVITIDDFIDATSEIYERTQRIIKNIIAYHSAIKIDKIILVGGSTKNEFIKQNMHDDYPTIKIYSDINPDECVALGASKNSYICLSNSSDVKFYDICSDSVGVQSLQDSGLSMQKMINKGSALPTKYTQKFYRQSQEQTSIRIPLYQGENRNCKYNNYLGEIRIADLPSSLSVSEPVMCTFEMSKSGILTASVRIKDITKSITINSKANMEPQIDEKTKKYLEALESIAETEEF